MKSKIRFSVLLGIVLTLTCAAFAACGDKGGGGGDICARGHTYNDDDTCTKCGYRLEATQGLRYALNDDNASYTVSGYRRIETQRLPYALSAALSPYAAANSGLANDINIVIPTKHNNLPVTAIADEAFKENKDITGIRIPSGITHIGAGVFLSCDNINVVTVEKGNTVYHSAEDCLIETETKTLILGCNNSVIPTDGSVTSIGEYAFAYRSTIMSVSVPDGVTSIGKGAFAECRNLTSITIPDSVTSIGEDAFKACDALTIYCKAESMPIGWNSEWKDGTCPVVWKCTSNDKDENGYAYSVMGGVRYALKDGVATAVRQSINISGEITIKESITYKDESYSVTEIEEMAFALCGELTGITIGNNVTDIRTAAFGGCSKLTSITIGRSVENIEEMAFEVCASIASITVASGNATFHSAGNCLIETGPKALALGCKNSVIPTDGSVTCIGEAAFRGCTGLTGIAIPESVTDIEVSAFEGCTGLTSITLPENVTSIGTSAFEECTGLTSITIPSKVTYIGQFAFRGCSALASVTIPPSVTRIDYGAFSECVSLTSIIFNGTQAQWTEIDKGADWDEGTGNYTVTYTNGSPNQSESRTMRN